jgi:hypothetical protein
MNRTTTILRDILNVTFTSIHVNDSVIAEEIRRYIKE